VLELSRGWSRFFVYVFRQIIIVVLIIVILVVRVTLLALLLALLGRLRLLDLVDGVLLGPLALLRLPLVLLCLCGDR